MPAIRVRFFTSLLPGFAVPAWWSLSPVLRARKIGQFTPVGNSAWRACAHQAGPAEMASDQLASGLESPAAGLGPPSSRASRLTMLLDFMRSRLTLPDLEHKIYNYYEHAKIYHARDKQNSYQLGQCKGSKIDL